MSDELKSSAQKVQKELQARGLNCKVVQMQKTTRTAIDAAQAVGCEVGQIVKSLIFKSKRSRKPILVVASGVNRVNEKVLGQQISESVKMANPEFVREMTGFIDEDLLQYEEIWAAAGTPHTVFRLTPAELKMITNGTVISVK